MYTFFFICIFARTHHATGPLTLVQGDPPCNEGDGTSQGATETHIADQAARHPTQTTFRLRSVSVEGS